MLGGLSRVAERPLDNRAHLFDRDGWDLSVSMMPVVDDGGLFGDTPVSRFVALSSSATPPNEGRDGNYWIYDSLGIGTCGGQFCLLVPRQQDGDPMTVVLGESYRVESTYQMSLRVVPDPD